MILSLKDIVTWYVDSQVKNYEGPNRFELIRVLKNYSGKLKGEIEVKAESILEDACIELGSSVLDFSFSRYSFATAIVEELKKRFLN